MIEFLIVAVLVGAAVLFLLLRPLWPQGLVGLMGPSAAPLRAADPSDTLAVLREQLLQLDALRAAGTLDDAAHRESRGRLERRIVEAVASPTVQTALAPAATSPDLQRRLPGVLPLALGLALAVVAGGYAWLGRPDALTPMPAGANGQASTAAGQGNAPHTMDTQQIRAMVDGLAQRLADNPADAEGWAMLARSWVTLGEPGRALQAYREALAAGVKDAALLADFADALAVANGSRIEGEALQQVQQALALDPDQPKALSLAGTAAFDRGDYAGAVAHWSHLQAVGPADHPLVKQMAPGLEEARQRLASNGGKAAGGGVPVSGGTPSAAASKSLRSAPLPADAMAAGAFVAGTVRLSPSLASQVRPDDTLFVFARAAEGPRMPLAVLRRQVKDLPLTFRLDDSLAMSPELKLSSQSKVVVGARISRSGQVTAQPGEPRVESQAVPLGRQDVVLTLDPSSP